MGMGWDGNKNNAKPGSGNGNGNEPLEWEGVGFKKSFPIVSSAERLLLQEFGGNSDRNTARYHYLSSPFVARYIRFHPVEWHKHVSMRAGLIGCPRYGKTVLVHRVHDSDVISSYHIYASCFPAMMWDNLCEMFVIVSSFS